VYRPAHFAEDRLEVLQELVRRHPLATLIAQRGTTIDADHVPVLIDPADGPYGTVRGHVARANNLWRTVAEHSEVLAIFNGDEHYVSPAWYPSKLDDGKVVPTWNYIVVHARGPIRFRHEPEWLHALVTRLTDTHEAARAEPWRVTDAPDDYIKSMLRAIVGFEIPLSSLTGKWKMSQNRSGADRDGVAAGLARESSRAVLDEPVDPRR
jgi:transcriptional regulator